MSRYGLEIRAGAASDAPLLAELFAASGLAADAAALAERIEAVRRLGGATLLAWEWGPPSGVIAFSRYAGLGRAGLSAHVTTLLVAPEARRRGVGRRLLKAASQAARQAGCETLLMNAGRQADGLVAFCEATGFTDEATVFERPLRKRS